MPAGEPSDFTPAPPPPEPAEVAPADPLLTLSVEQLQQAGYLARGTIGVNPDEDVPLVMGRNDAVIGEPAQVLPPPEPVPAPSLPDVNIYVSREDPRWVRAWMGDGPSVAWRADQIVGLRVLEDEAGWVLGVELVSGEVQVAGRWGIQAEADRALVVLLGLLAGGGGRVSPEVVAQSA